MADVVGYLESKGIPVKRADAYNIHTNCFFCGEDSTKRGRLYINIDPEADPPGLYKCLAGETEVITRDGIHPIKNLAGGTHTLMTEAGRWVDAPVRAFGEQELMKLTLGRNGVEKVIYATPDHRWFVKASHKGGHRREVLTEQLRPGYALTSVFGQGCKHVRPSAFGIARGIVFGDGTLTGRGASLSLFKPELAAWFPLSPRSHHEIETGTAYTRIADLPAYFKDRPSLNESRSYLYGWLAGYFAADGNVSEDSTVTLASASLENLQFVEQLCLRIGLGTYGPRGPYFGKDRHNDEPMYSISFMRSTLAPAFFLRPRHRELFSIPAYERTRWVVRSVEKTNRHETVYCATVDGYHSFALAGNILTGNCFRCEGKGNLVTLKRHFGDPLTTGEIDSVTRTEILTAAAHYYVHNLVMFTEVLAYLKGPQRGLTINTIGDHQLGYAPMAFTQDMATDTVTVTRPNLLYQHLRTAGWDTAPIMATGLCVEGRDDRIVDAFAGMITVPYLVAGTVVAIRGRTWPYLPEDFDTWTGAHYQPAKAKYRTLTGDRARLYNSDACWTGDDEIVIAEGEMDCLVLEQHGYHAVGVPGATIWQDTWNSYFDNVRRAYVVFDRDPTGETAAGKLVERLGAKARRIHLSEPNVKCDPTDWFGTHSIEDFNALLATARKGDMLVSVGDAIDEFREVQGKPGIRFAWPLFDEMIAPGLQPGQVMIVLAKTNSGKTLALLNFMHRMRMVPEQRDLKFLFISLEQTRGEWWDRARRIHRFYNLHQNEDDAARWWRDHILLVDRNRVTEAQLFTVIEDFTYEMGAPPDVICMDYLGYFSRSFRGEAYMRTSDAIMSVKALAKASGIPVVMPHQVNRTATDGQEISSDTGRESGVVEETADLLLTMWSPDNLFGRADEEKTGQVHLRIGKSRHGGRGTLLNLQFAPISLALVPEGDPLCGQARREVSWVRPPHRETWEQAVYRHRCGIEEGALVSGPFAPPVPKVSQQRWV